MYVYGHPIAPCALTDAQGNVSVVMVGLQRIENAGVTLPTPH